MKRILVPLAIAMFLAFTAVYARDEAEAIHGWMDRFVDAWNKNDIEGLAQLWAEDGDLINPFGRRANSRAQIEQVLRSDHTALSKDTTYKITDSSIRFLKTDVAVLDWDCEVTGMKGADGKEQPPFKHHVTWVLVKHAGEWLAATSRPAAPVAMPADGATNRGEEGARSESKNDDKGNRQSTTPGD